MADGTFWARAAGAWAGEASYFDGAMQPIIPQYGNVLRIEAFPGGEVAIHEWKQYAPSELARRAAGGTLPPDQGFEVTSVQRGRLDAAGALDFGADGRFVPVEGHSVMRDQRDPETGASRYRVWHTLSGEAVLATMQYGFWYTPFEADYYNRPLRDPASGETRPNSRLGQVKGVSVFRYRRIDLAGIDAARAARRARFQVRAPAAPRPPAPVTRG
jgi:hypothetical protein